MTTCASSQTRTVYQRLTCSGQGSSLSSGTCHPKANNAYMALQAHCVLRWLMWHNVHAQGNMRSCCGRFVTAKRTIGDPTRLLNALAKFHKKDESKKYHVAAAYLQQAFMGTAALTIIVPTGYIAHGKLAVLTLAAALGLGHTPSPTAPAPFCAASGLLTFTNAARVFVALLALGVAGQAACRWQFTNAHGVLSDWFDDHCEQFPLLSESECLVSFLAKADVQELMGDYAYAIGLCATPSRLATQFSPAGFLMSLACEALLCEGYAQGLFELIFFGCISAAYIVVAHIAHMTGSPRAR